MKYKHPVNGYTQRAGDSASWLWCFLFGPLYFAVRRNWTHFFLCLVLALCTFGISQLIYPFFVYRINRRDLLMKGWTEVSND